MATASEADFIAEEPPPIPMFSWGGAYVGLHAGYTFGHDHAAIASASPGAPSSLGASPDGLIGGGHLGYLVSTRGLTGLGALGGARDAGVVGIEGDIDGTNFSGSNFEPGAASGLNYAAVRSPLRGSIRARFGLAAQRVLFYGTGGVAFERLTTSEALAGSEPEAFSHTRAGYTLGGGIEWALMNSLSLRAEYRFDDFGRSVDQVSTGGPATVAVVHRDSSQRLQTGISYRLGGSTPQGGVAAP